MPDDGSRRARRPLAGIRPFVEPTVGGIVRDALDVRDRHYEPTLQRLLPELVPHDLFDVLRDAGNPWKLPRNQGAEGTCGGMALAALIDIERARADIAPNDRYPSSPRMIYQCALLKSAAAGEGVSLRDVIKAFYNYGVCRETLWRYVAGDRDPGTLNVARARDARNTSLGAYYRLRPNLNTYHAALHETGAVVVSAELHDGWSHAALAANGGRIVPPQRGAPRGRLGAECHAFVIVGYTREGFLVLNSWGRGWGNWKPPGLGKREEVPGIGLWRYEDWADSVVDGWVLRLGVGTDEAFEFSIGDQGLGFGAEAPVRSTPVHAILGHFLHLDDGDYVRNGAYVSTRVTLRETLQLLKDDAARPEPYRGTLLTFAGALLGLKEAAEHVARWRPQARSAGWYAFTVLWCVDYVEQARQVLEGVFEEARARVGKPGGQLDRAIEERAHGVGRAFWRDILCAAKRGARPDGPLHDLARAAVELRAARPEFRLRIVAESEGAYALAALLHAMDTPHFAAERDAFFAMLESVDLVAPPLTHAEYSGLAFYLDKGWKDFPARRITLHLPTGRDEKRLTVPPYGASYFELARLAFQRRGDADPRPAEIVCGSRARAAIATKWDDWRAVPRTLLAPIGWPKGKAPQGQRPITQAELVYRSDVAGRLRTALGPRPV